MKTYVAWAIVSPKGNILEDFEGRLEVFSRKEDAKDELTLHDNKHKVKKITLTKPN